MAEEAVLKYLTDQNRPYNASTIFMNLHQAIGKTDLQKALDTLVENGSVKDKEYGPLKMYYVTPSSSVIDEGARQELKLFNEKVKQLSEELSGIQRKLHSSESLLKAVQSVPEEVAMEQRKCFQENILKLKVRLKALTENGATISKKEQDEVLKKYELYTRQWHKRKLCCMAIIDSIAESYPKSKEELLEELEIETDEDVGVSPPPPLSIKDS